MSRLFQIPGMAALVCAVHLAIGSPAAAQSNNLMQNGSFELGPNPGGYLNVTPGSGVITGWTVINGSIDYIGSFWQHSDGLRSLDLHGTPSSGGVSQVVPVTPGKLHRLRFDLSGNPGFGNTMHMRVEVVGIVSHDYSFDTQGRGVTGMGWEQKEFWFRSNAPQVEVRAFSTMLPTTDGPAVDNFILEEFSFQLDVPDLVAGQSVQVQTLEATPGGQVVVGYSLQGPGPIATPYGDLLLTKPYSTFNMPVSDAAGNAQASVFVPPAAVGATVWIHGFDFGCNCFCNDVYRVVQS